MRAPSREVLDAFGVGGAAQRLAGGQGGAYLVDGIVLKRVDDAAETAWTYRLLSRLEPDGFRVAEPVPTTGGEWVHDGWAATSFITGLRSLNPRWGDVIATGLRFCDAAEQAREDDGGALAARTHRWAIADRVAWGEQPLEVSAETAELFADIAAEFDDVERQPQFVHGDLNGNVFVDEHGTPVVLDVSPYLRPRRWAAAIVVCDALLWHHADQQPARALAAREERSLLFRALAFRLLADELGRRLTDGRPPHQTYRTVIASLR